MSNCLKGQPLCTSSHVVRRQERRYQKHEGRTPLSPAHINTRCAAYSHYRCPSEQVRRTGKTVSRSYIKAAERKGTALQGGTTFTNLYTVDRFTFSTLKCTFLIHSLNRNRLISLLTTAALLFYNFFWQLHQIAQNRGNREMNKIWSLRGIGF